MAPAPVAEAIDPAGPNPGKEPAPALAPLERLGDTPLMADVVAYLDVPSAARLARAVSRRLAGTLRPQGHLGAALHQRIGLVRWEGEPARDGDSSHGGTDDDPFADAVRRWRYSQALLRPTPVRRRRSPQTSALEKDPVLPEQAWRFMPLVGAPASALTPGEGAVVGPDSLADDPVVEWDREDILGLVGGTAPRLVWIHPLSRHVVLQSLPQRAHAATVADQILLDHDAFRMEDYFPADRHRDLQVHVRYLGLEVSPRLDSGERDRGRPAVVGTDVSAARTIVAARPGPWAAMVVEVLSWFLPGGTGHQDSVHVGHRSRIQFTNARFWTIIPCARRQVLYANPYLEPAGAPVVEVYALHPDTSDPEPSSSHSEKCPKSPLIVRFNVGESVQAMVACPSSHRLIVCTVRARMQVWDVSRPAESVLVEQIRMPEALSAMLRNRHSPSLNDIFERTVDEIFVAKHMPIHLSGFMTFQFERDGHCSVVVWKRPATDETVAAMEASFLPVSVILLPVSAHRKPRLYFDGRRLIVYAHDQIGFLVLVYHVRLNSEDNVLFQTTANHEIGIQGDGNVYNLTDVPHVRFANLIRHELLGGTESWENLHMACNERFLVFNCRRPYEPGQAHRCEGLAVIDLEAALEASSSIT